MRVSIIASASPPTVHANRPQMASPPDVRRGLCPAVQAFQLIGAPPFFHSLKPYPFSCTHSLSFAVRCEASAPHHRPSFPNSLGLRPQPNNLVDHRFDFAHRVEAPNSFLRTPPSCVGGGGVAPERK